MRKDRYYKEKIDEIVNDAYSSIVDGIKRLGVIVKSNVIKIPYSTTYCTYCMRDGSEPISVLVRYVKLEKDGTLYVSEDGDNYWFKLNGLISSTTPNLYGDPNPYDVVKVHDAILDLIANILSYDDE